MEFRNHQVWVKQRLAEFSGRPVATLLLVLVVIVLIIPIIAIAAVVLSIGIVVTLLRAVLSLGRGSKPLPSAGQPNSTVIDVQVTRAEDKP